MMIGKKKTVIIGAFAGFIQRILVLFLLFGMLAAHAGCARKGLVAEKYPGQFYHVSKLGPNELMNENPQFIVYGDARSGWRLEEKFLLKRNWLTWKMLIFPFYELYWLDKDGKTHEKIYDAAVSDGRKIGADGRCKTPVGSTVNVKDASYTNTIGDPLLTAYWVDPEFDSKQRAFYYVRVLEIPKPRWTAYDAKFFGIEMPKDVAMTVQDRAYTSPIWYTP